jgi:hypothetical protein
MGVSTQAAQCDAPSFLKPHPSAHRSSATASLVAAGRSPDRFRHRSHSAYRCVSECW